MSITVGKTVEKKLTVKSKTLTIIDARLVKWEVDQYLQDETLGGSEFCIRSQNFTIGKLPCFLQIKQEFPAVKDYYTNWYIHLRLCSEKRDRSIYYWFAVANLECDDFFPGEIMSYESSWWGTPNHFMKDLCSVKLRAREHIKCSLINVSFSLYMHKFESPHQLTFQRLPVDTLSKAMSTWFNNPDKSDVEFIVDKEVFYGHKEFLATRSEVLKAMFAHDSLVQGEKKTLPVCITDTAPNIFKEFLRFLYTDEFGADVSTDMVEGLLVLGDKYHVAGLKVLCGDYLGLTISVENALSVLITADRHGVPELREGCVEFIARSMDLFVCEPEWKRFVRENIDLSCEIMQFAFKKTPPVSLSSAHLKSKSQAVSQASSSNSS